MTDLPNPSGVLQLHLRDNVAIAMADLLEGALVSTISGIALTLNQSVAKGHKVAVQPITAGSVVLKYGQVIGVATSDIPAGSHVHEHNLAPSADRLAPPDMPTSHTCAASSRTFRGFRRNGRRAGTRNYVAVATTVNCSATVVHAIVDTARARNLLASFPNIDGIVAITHQSGCAMARSGEAYDMLRRTIVGAITNPNIGGALVVGLGCEVIQADALLADASLGNDAAYQTVVIQEAGGTAAAIDAGIAALVPVLHAANNAGREECPVSDLVLGLQCGGSDGWSGASCNPALGNAADRLIAHGGTVLLSETPEIVGAEHLLVSRAASKEVADRLIDRIAWWHGYASAHGVALDNNPSPGNKAGGLTTILEKSLGAVAKAGTSQLVEVIHYAEPVTARGLVFMDSPGFDPCSATGQIASGANLIAFTTGRGSAFGAQPTPSLKLSSNTEVWRRMPGDIDIDCGPILDGAETVASMGETIFEQLVSVASGEATKSEQLGYGRFEFVPWNIGAIL